MWETAAFRSLFAAAGHAKLGTIEYQGKRYRLNRYSQSGVLPFDYSFESDGDLDLVINGREYEIESPYDRDSTKKKT